MKNFNKEMDERVMHFLEGFQNYMRQTRQQVLQEPEPKKLLFYHDSEDEEDEAVRSYTASRENLI